MKSIIKTFTKVFGALLLDIHGLIWTLAANAIVLVTLSGELFDAGLKISIIALVVHLLGVVLITITKKDK